MNVLSLFDGISGCRVALEKADIKVGKYFSSEIDPYAISITQNNYPDTIQIGNVIDTDFEEFRSNISLLAGGSPCTFWSIAKQNREIDKDGEGWKLFSRFVDALRIVRPKYFFYENVASMPKTIKEFISQEFRCEPILVNSALVSAQQRNRLYWTNIPEDTLPEDRHIYLKDILESGVAVDVENQGKLIVNFPVKSQTLMARDYKGFGNQRMTGVLEAPIRLGELNKGGQGDRIYSVEGKSVTLSANGGGRGAKTGLYATNEGVRKLTPVECERLQTLPDNYSALGTDFKGNTVKISNTQRYKAVNNGWTTEVPAHFFRKMKQ